VCYCPRPTRRHGHTRRAGGVDGPRREFGGLREHRISIGVLAVVGTLLSTIIVGGLCWLLTHSLGLGLTPYHCLLFGALISPTGAAGTTGSPGLFLFSS
jgi:NhaP-type Na+/H+ or K+/H+ antiporter